MTIWSMIALNSFAVVGKNRFVASNVLRSKLIWLTLIRGSLVEMSMSSVIIVFNDCKKDKRQIKDND